MNLLRISRCKGCGTRFTPFRLVCPACRRPLPIALPLLIAGIFALVWLLLVVLSRTIGWPPGF